MSITPRRRWNGYGLSWWFCQRCHSARKPPSVLVVNGEGRLTEARSTPCKRCGDERDPVCSGDPWAGYEEVPV